MTVLEGFAELLSSKASAQDCDDARLHLFDALIAAYAGASTVEGRLVACDLEREPSVTRGSWVPNRKAGLNASEATRALARLIRSTEIDDIQLEACTTPAGIVIPAALGAVAHSEGVSAERFLTAILVGYETVERLGRAAGGPRLFSAGAWPTFFTSAFGAAATSAIVLGLDVEQLANALALVAPLLPAWRPNSSDSRWFSFGLSVTNGVAGAIAARSGSAGAKDLFEAAPANASGQPVFAPEVLTEPVPLGAGLAAARMKRWCSAAQVAGAIDAFCWLSDEFGLDAGEIDRVEVEVPGWYRRMIDRPIFRDRMASIVSAQYQLATAALYRADLWDCRRIALREDDEFGALAQRISVNEDSALEDPDFATWPARVRIHTTSGMVHEHVSAGVSPSPLWSWALVQEKAVAVASSSELDVDVSALGHLVRGFETAEDLIAGLQEL